MVTAALAAVLVWWPGAARRWRVRERLGRGAGEPGALRGAHLLLALTAGVLPALLLGPWGALVGAVLAVLALVALRAGTEEQPVVEGLPLVLDLLAAGMRAGAPLPVVLDAVAAARGPCAPACAQLAARLRVGGDPSAAEAGLGPLTEVLLRSARTGAAPAASLAESATELRARAASAGAERARRAGVRAVLPLATCFLPAFVLVGVVPIALGLAPA